MGQSTPTTTQMLDEFVLRYAGFRAELPRREQHCFDELVARARRHSNALNRRPHLDFERPVMLSMLMESMSELSHTRSQLERTEVQLREVSYALKDAGLLTRRIPTRTPEQLDRMGQTTLSP